MSDQTTFDKFTIRTSKVFTLAQQEAQRLHSNVIGTNHLLLGLLTEGKGIGANVLEQQGIDLKKASTDVEALPSNETPAPSAGGLTVEAKNVVELAAEEARTFKHNYIGTEHLLLGLLREEQGSAFSTLKNLSVELARTRTLVIETLNRERQKHNPDTSN